MKPKAEHLKLDFPMDDKEREAFFDLQVDILAQLLQENAASPEQRRAALEFWTAHLQEREF